ncbi:hypothetical protein D3C81_2058720 [compost metagenome]
MVLVSKTAARPAQHRDVQSPQCREYVVSNAAGVRNRRILAHPDAFVDTAAEMLGEVPVNMAADRSNRLIGIDRDFGNHPLFSLHF